MQQNTIIKDIVIKIHIQKRKINLITEGLEPRYANSLGNLSKENAIAIVDFILNTKIEINLSENHKRNYISLLTQLSKFYHNKKSFKEMNRQDIRFNAISTEILCNWMRT